MTKPKSQINKVAPTKVEVKAEVKTEATETKLPEEAKADESAEASYGGAAAEAKQEKNPKSKYPESIVKRAQEVFGSHTSEEIFFTSDLNCFTIEQYAVMHGQNLKDQDVLTVKRSEV